MNRFEAKTAAGSCGAYDGTEGIFAVHIVGCTVVYTIGCAAFTVPFAAVPVSNVTAALWPSCQAVSGRAFRCRNRLEAKTAVGSRVAGACGRACGSGGGRR
eukprot:7037648-Pyramimonas_sp.AAC.1